MKITLTSDLVLIRRINNEAPKTSWGFELPQVEESNDTPWRGEVVATGPGKLAKMSPAGREVVDALQELVNAFKGLPHVTEGPRGISLAHWQSAIQALEDQEHSYARLPMQVKVGDIVVFSKNLYQEFKLDGEVLLATHEDSILGVLDHA